MILPIWAAATLYYGTLGIVSIPIFGWIILMMVALSAKRQSNKPVYRTAIAFEDGTGVGFLESTDQHIVKWSEYVEAYEMNDRFDMEKYYKGKKGKTRQQFAEGA